VGMSLQVTTWVGPRGMRPELTARATKLVKGKTRRLHSTIGDERKLRSFLEEFSLHHAATNRS
jgi:hypothetical protein